MRKFSNSVAILVIFHATNTALAGTFGFSNQTTSAGLDITYPASSFDSWVMGGTVGDFNGDGFQDIFYCGRNQLLINNGDGTFSNQAQAWGIPMVSRSSSASAADYNNDGYLDLYLSLYEDADHVGDVLWKNNGNSTFSDLSLASGIQTSMDNSPITTSWGSAWGDYDLDGDLDLAISKWFGFSQFNALFRNNGNGTFTNNTESAGLDFNVGTPQEVRGFTTRFVDLNEDRFPELIWISDFGRSRYFVNNTDGTFTDNTLASGINVGGTEMGMTVGDYNLDGLLDIYVTLIGFGNMYLNQGGHTFVLAPQDTSEHPQVWGWGTVSIDFDHDSRVDIITTSQFVSFPGAQFGQTAIRNQTIDNNLSFVDVTSQALIDSDEDGRGLVNFDYDNDGDQDVLVFDRSGPLALYRNDLTGPDTNWLRVFLDATGATDIPPDGIGSVVKIRLGDVWRIGRIDGGSNYLSQSEMSAHFGLAGATVVDELRVEWTSGAVTTLYDVPANQTMTIAACPPYCTPPKPGDTNCDQRLDGFDIEGFTLALLAPATYAAVFPACNIENADVVDDDQIDALDVAAFVELILNENGDEPLDGDVNCDTVVDGRDINAFLMALTRPGDFPTAYPGCDAAAADQNGDGSTDVQDVPLLVARVLGP